MAERKGERMANANKGRAGVRRAGQSAGCAFALHFLDDCSIQPANKARGVGLCGGADILVIAHQVRAVSTADPARSGNRHQPRVCRSGSNARLGMAGRQRLTRRPEDRGLMHALSGFQGQSGVLNLAFPVRSGI